MTIIEIRQFRNGWQVYECPGVQPVFLTQEQAIDYATGRACFRSGEIRVLDSTGSWNARLRLTRRIECCDCGAVMRFIDR
jgi:hypothetical protein